MVPGVGLIIELNQQFIDDVRSRGGRYEQWMAGRDADTFQVQDVEKAEHQRLKYIYRVSYKNLRTQESCRTTITKEGKHAMRQLSEAPVFKFQATEADVCVECGVVGEMFKTACVCRCCGQTVWGC